MRYENALGLDDSQPLHWAAKESTGLIRMGYNSSSALALAFGMRIRIGASSC